ncbi:MAG: ExeM/NucH family extracellular endonuclease [Pseudomonadota bacterium]
MALTLALPLVLAAPADAAVVISQVYGGGGNAGAVYKRDFIEIFNNGSSPASVGGWSVQYASATGSSWQVTNIPAGVTLQPGQYLLIGEATGAGGTTDFVSNVEGTIALSGTAGKVALSNGGAPLTGTAPTGSAVLDIVSFGPTATPTEGTPTAVLSNTTAALRNAVGCTDTNNNSADFSIGAPTPRNTATAVAPCGGDGGGAVVVTPPTPAAIYAIQGSGATSPLAGKTVITSGVVTKLLNNGFFIQDPIGDGNSATSDGILVFTSTAPPATAVVGNLVQVTGTVVEFSTGSSTLTEIGSVTAVTLVGSGQAIAPTPVTLPLAAGDSLERFEGMLVRIDAEMTVQQNYFQARYGQLTVGAGGRHETPTNRYRPGSAQAVELADLQARSRLLLDDGSSLQNTNPTAFAMANGVPRAGDLVNNLVGVLDYGPATATASGPGLYRLQPTAAPAFASTNLRAAAPAVSGNVTLASMNVLNFFTTFTNGSTAFGQTGQGCTLGASTSASNCRGANSLAEFERQRAKIVVALAGMNADAVGLMEIQNNGNTAPQNLVDALNEKIGAGTYAAVPVPAAGTGTDAIRVAMIYKPARLALVGAPASDTAAINNRPTLAQTFAAANGEKFTLLVNHLKSKSSCPAANDPDAAGNVDIGDGQGCWNGQRLQQAQRLRTFVAQLQAGGGSDDVLLVGDFNAYAQEDPIHDLVSNGYIDQSGRFEQFGYSYVFDGTAGRLDHAITTATLSPKVLGTKHWHIDADESLAQDYNVEFKQPACATCAPDPYDGSVPFRASDHDPVLVGLNLFKTFIGTARRDEIVGSPGDDVIIGGVGGDTLTGGGGVNVFVYTSMRDAGDTITDFVPGTDFLDLRSVLAEVGYAGADPVADGVVTFFASPHGATIRINHRPLLTLSGVAPDSLRPSRDLIVR